MTDSPFTEDDTAGLTLNEDKIEYNYELKRRIRKSSDFIGFDNSDVVYLITPDRFSNGDIKNDSFEDLKETNVNRGEDYSRHGGDLMGIYNNVKYIKEMGFSAIWTNPFVVNDMYRYSYHGYSITDHYRIDPRFGTLKEAKLLLKIISDIGIKLILYFKYIFLVTLFTFTSVVWADSNTDTNRVNLFLCFKGIGVFG